MLYHILYPLASTYAVFNVFKYISFRTLGASLTALTVSLVLGPYFIEFLSRKQARQVVRDDGPRTHLVKTGIATVDGVLMLTSFFSATLLWADLSNRYVWFVLGITFFYGLIGFVDDYLKVMKKNPKGISGKTKLFFQIIFGLVIVWFLFQVVYVDTSLKFPFFKNLTLDLGWFYIPFIIFVIVGTSNAVNLTDGLDGLAIGPIMIAFATFGIFVYLAGHYTLSHYLQIPYIRNCGELTVVCASIVASGLGFLWFNSYPATVFMGDIGSLALGAALAMVAAVSKNEILLTIVGGIFVIEALSVMAQVFSYKLFRKRVLKMAPIHHHFELKGWAEPKVIVRFWIISIILALIALSTLKLR